MQHLIRFELSKLIKVRFVTVLALCAMLCATFGAQPRASFATFASTPVITGASIPCGSNELIVYGDGFGAKPQVSLILGQGRRANDIPLKLAQVKSNALVLLTDDFAEGSGQLIVDNGDGQSAVVNADITWDTCTVAGADDSDGVIISGSYRITVR